MKELLELARGVSPFVVGYEGNVSAKVEGDRFLIKGSGKRLRDLREEDLALCDSTGSSIDSKIPSMESLFHAWLLQLDSVNFVAHTHPVNVLKIVSTNKAHKFSRSRFFPDQVVFNGKKSCVIDYAHPGEELAEKIKDGVTRFERKEGFFPSVILLKNHGVICVGKTHNECVISTEIVEKSAEIYLTSAGDIDLLSEEDIEKLLRDKKEIFRKSRP